MNYEREVPGGADQYLVEHLLGRLEDMAMARGAAEAVSKGMIHDMVIGQYDRDIEAEVTDRVGEMMAEIITERRRANKAPKDHTKNWLQNVTDRDSVRAGSAGEGMAFTPFTDDDEYDIFDPEFYADEDPLIIDGVDHTLDEHGVCAACDADGRRD